MYLKDWKSCKHNYRENEYRSGEYKGKDHDTAELKSFIWPSSKVSAPGLAGWTSFFKNCAACYDHDEDEKNGYDCDVGCHQLGNKGTEIIGLTFDDDLIDSGIELVIVKS